MVVGGWCPGQVIGRGSTATVSLATALASGELFAVKSAELSRAGILLREQRILSAINSPYVVAHLGFDVAPLAFGSSLYYNLFLEYAPGGSLGDEIKRQSGHLDELAIRCLACDILRGLDYLHSNGIVHCDVKSQNILIGLDGRAKIGDLGCALLAADEDGVDNKERTQLRGTPMFMAPEVARGEEQGMPADIWALGCTVIEMATGRPPWPDVSDPISALNRIAFSGDMPEFPIWISDEGKDFLSKCLRRDPKQRWTAKQLLEHPFVMSSSSAANFPSKASINCNWISPKSTLDQVLWESQSDEEEDEIKQPADDPFQRIQLLIDGGGGHPPNWTWDENWSTVRSDGREQSFSWEDNLAREDESVENSFISSSSINSSSSNEFLMDNNGRPSSQELIISTNLMEIVHNIEFNSTNAGDHTIDVQFEEENEQHFSCKRAISSCNGDCFGLNQCLQFKTLKWLSSFHLVWFFGGFYTFYFLCSVLVELDLIQSGLDRD